VGQRGATGTLRSVGLSGHAQKPHHSFPGLVQVSTQLTMIVLLLSRRVGSSRDSPEYGPLLTSLYLECVDWVQRNLTFGEPACCKACLGSILNVHPVTSMSKTQKISVGGMCDIRNECMHAYYKFRVETVLIIWYFCFA